MMERAYSFLEIKGLDEEQRVIRGLATTPQADRMGDVVEPGGAQFKLPIPLLWQHDKSQPIGSVTAARITAAGIEIDAHIPKGISPRIDEAWALVKAGIVRGLSIGFKPRDSERMKADDGSPALRGVRFKVWEWLELSCVTVPANAGASISVVKSIDHELLAASGRNAQRAVVRLDDPPPGVSGTPQRPASGGFFVPVTKAADMRTTAEQITAFEAKRAASAARMGDIMNKSAELGETLDEATEQEYEALGREVKSVDTHLARLRAHEQIVVSKAVPLGDVGSSLDAGSAARGGIISVRPNVAKGTAFARYVRLLASSHGNLMQAAEMAKQYQDSTPEVAEILKSAVAAGTTTDSAWAAPLVPYRQMTAEFIALLRPSTILGKFGQNGVPSLRQVPFNIKMPTQTGGSTVNWVGQLAPKPVSALAFSNLTLDFTKTAGIVVISEELARLSTPSAEAIITNDLIEQTAQFLDGAFINPALTAVSGVSPASITNGATAISASGTDADHLRNDIRRLIAAFQLANLSTAGAVFIMTETQATALSMMVNALGQNEFPNVTAMGGTLFGIPVITSENVTQTTAGSPPVTTSLIVLIKASEVLLADDGQVTIDVSREASLQMDSAPTNPPVGATVMVSLWQMNMVGIRAERWVNWVRRRAGSVAYISNANYTG